MEDVSPISLGPLIYPAIFVKNPLFFWSKMRRREDGIASSFGGRSRLAVLSSTVFLKSSTLGGFASLAFSPNRRVYVPVLSRKTEKVCRFFAVSFRAVFSGF